MNSRMMSLTARYSKVGITSIIMLLSVFNGAFAQSRAYLKDKLRFYYVSDPNNTSLTPPLLDNAKIAVGTEIGTFWSSNVMDEAQALVRALLCPRENGGDETLQDYAAGIVKIIDKPVRVYLYNDVGISVSAKAEKDWKLCSDRLAVAHVWPCASNQSIADEWARQIAECLGDPLPDRQDNKWAGSIHMGAFHMNAYGTQWAKSTFIHEIVHTQDRSDNRAHLFWVKGTQFRYGNDQSHYLREAVPNLAMTYKEGIANTYTLLYDYKAGSERFDWFANHDTMLVEVNPYPTGSGSGAVHPCLSATTPSPDAWLYTQLQNAGVQQIGSLKTYFTNASGVADSTIYGKFRVRDLPARFIVHNEFIIALIFAGYVDHVGISVYANALREANDRLFLVSASGIATLFEVLCKASLPMGETYSSLEVSSNALPKYYLLPLAYADYFTQYKTTTKSEFKELFEGMLPSQLVDLYWDGERMNVRSSVPFTNPKYEDLTDIAIALGITQSGGPGGP